MLSSTNKAVKIGIGVFATVLLVLLYVVRLAEINDGFKGYPKEVFDRAEAASYDDMEHGSEMVAGDIEVRVTSFDSIMPDEIEEEYNYVDPISTNDDVRDMRFLIVGLTIRNCSTEEKEVFAGKYELESGAWINGLNLPLYLIMNENDSVQGSIAPDEEMRVYLPYSAYDQQFGDSWSGFDDRSFELVLAVQPKIYLIDLGRFDGTKTL